jgi:hypothetical protein
MRRGGSRMEGKKLPRRNFGMASSTSLGRAVIGPFIAFGADHRAELGLDELLADQAH